MNPHPIASAHGVLVPGPVALPLPAICITSFDERLRISDFLLASLASNLTPKVSAVLAEAPIRLNWPDGDLIHLAPADLHGKCSCTSGCYLLPPQFILVSTGHVFDLVRRQDSEVVLLDVVIHV
jgi:hypothetical protein